MNSLLLPSTPLFADTIAFGPRPLAHSLAVQSSLLVSVAYDHDRATLQLEFGSGAIYQYFGVPVQSYQQLLQSASHGTYFNRNIRGLFRFVLLPPA